MAPINELRADIKLILSLCSRKPHTKQPHSAEVARDLLRDIEKVAFSMADKLSNRPYTGPARDGLEAQHGLNDIFPGDPYPPSPTPHTGDGRE